MFANATKQFVDVNNAGPAGYEPAFGCVSGPDHGAMGIHYVNGAHVKKNELYIDSPQALIYEPIGNKRQLVGVEYIVDVKKWLKDHDGATAVTRRTGLPIRWRAKPLCLGPIFSSCTCGRGGKIRKALSWTGTIT